MSMPAVVPHFLPAGSWPQLRLTCGAGFGNPWPVIGSPAAAVVPEDDAAAALSPDPLAPHAARMIVALAATTRRKILVIDIGLLEFVRPGVSAGRWWCYSAGSMQRQR